jgi:hypothetical protein
MPRGGARPGAGRPRGACATVAIPSGGQPFTKPQRGPTNAGFLTSNLPCADA